MTDAAPAPAPLPAAGAPMAPEAAQAEITTLRADRDFVAKFINGDAEARARMAGLHQMAYPEPGEAAPADNDAPAQPNVELIPNLPLAFAEDAPAEQRVEQTQIVSEAVASMGLERDLARGGVAMLERGIAARGGREMDAIELATFETRLQGAWGNDYDAKLDAAIARLERSGPKARDWLRRAAMAAGPDVAAWLLVSLADGSQPEA